MGIEENYYDFHCGNDTRLIKIAIKDDSFHTVKIEADVAKTIDFSGGTKSIDTIILNNCFKIVRIIWPYDTGAIKKLYIHSASTLTRLNLSSFENLESLSILNCESLEEIVGIPKNLKVLNLHYVNINALDLNAVTNIETVNIISICNKLKLSATHRNFLYDVYLSLANTNNDKSSAIYCNLSNSPALRILFVESSKTTAKIDIRNCYGLTEAIIIGGEKSSITGINDCKQLTTFIDTSHHLNFSDISANQLLNRIQKNTGTKNYPPEVLIAKAKSDHISFYKQTLNYQLSIHDRETIIQETGSGDEFDHGVGVKIFLLSFPKENIIEIDENKLSHIKKNAHYGMHDILKNPVFSFLYLEESSGIQRPYKVFNNTRTLHDNPNAINEWLVNADKRRSNILLLTDRDFENPACLQFIQAFKDNRNHINYQGTKYTFNPTDDILLVGDFNRMEAFTPGLARISVAIPLALISADSITEKPLKSNDNVDILTETYQLSHHLKNLDPATSEKLISLSNNFNSAFTQLNDMSILRDTTRNIDTSAAEANQSVVKTTINKGKKASYTNDSPLNLSNNNINRETPYIHKGAIIPDQSPVKGKSEMPDNQQNIDAASQTEPNETPDKKGVFIPQVKIKHENIPSQQEINGGSDNSDPEPLSLKPSRHNIKFISKLKTRHNHFTPQHLIHNEKQNLPSEKPPLKTANSPNIEEQPQTLIDKNGKKSELNIPDSDLIHGSKNTSLLPHATQLDADSTNPQQLINKNKNSSISPEKKPDAINDQTLVQADKLHHDVPINEQHLIDHSSSSNRQQDVTPLTPDETEPQILINVQKEQKETTINEQVNILAEAHSPATNIQTLKPDTVSDQTKLQVDKQHLELNINEQFLIDHSSESRSLPDAASLTPEETESQILINIQKERKERKEPAIIEQVNIHAEARASDNNYNQKLLDAAKALALATQEMLDAACAHGHESKEQTEELARAASLIKAANTELADVKYIITKPVVKTAKSIYIEDLVTASEILTRGLTALNEACKKSSAPVASAINHTTENEVSKNKND